MNQQITQLCQEMRNLEKKLSMSQSELKTAQNQLSERTKSLKQAKKKLCWLENTTKADTPTPRTVCKSPDGKKKPDQTPFYTAKKDDKVDQKLAEFVNSCTPPIPVQFVREAPGIYLFGSKKVFMKIE